MLPTPTDLDAELREMKELARQRLGGRARKIERILNRAERSGRGLETAVAEVAVTHLLFVPQSDIEGLALRMREVLERSELTTTSGEASLRVRQDATRSATAVEQHAEQAAFIPAILGGAVGIFLFGGTAAVHGYSITTFPGLLYAAGILACIAGPIVISQTWYSIIKSWSNASDLVVVTSGMVWLVAIFAVAFGRSFLSIDDLPRILQYLWTHL